MYKSITRLISSANWGLKIKIAKTKVNFGILLLFIFLLSSQCVLAQPTITSFAPINGKVGDTITISGTNFNTTATNNIVFFGATKATVTLATVTSLKVTVPIGANYAPITILNTATGLAAYSTQFFNLTFTPNKGSITTLDFAPHADFSAGYLPVSVSVGDFDGDGKSDLASANINSNIVSILRNTGSSGMVSFATPLNFATGASPISTAIGDIDGDGKLDLAVTNSSSATVSVFRNTSSSGTISFATKVDFATGLNPSSVAIGDINGDGKSDLTIANTDSYTASVLRNTSSSGTISFAAKVDFATGSGPFSIAIGDIDGNGKPDLAITNNYDSSVSVLANTSSTSTISFATRVNFRTGKYPQFVAIGDMDGDGKLDLATANNGSNFVSVIRNTSSSGSISFATKVDFTMISYPQSLNIGDIDGDGKPDLAVANGGYSVSVIRNTGSIGTISFATRVDFTSGAYAISVAISDVDGDGKPDLAVINRNDGDVAVFRNNPYYPPPTIISYTPISGAVGTIVNITGTLFNPIPANNVVFFGATRAIVTAATDTSLAVIVPTGATFAPLTVLNTRTNAAAYSTQFFNPTFSPNLGVITAADITPKVDFATDAGPTSVAVGDIDGDGKADLVIANANNSSVSILRNTSINGVVSYATKVDFAVGYNPISVAISDLDGDGKLDLAVVNYGSSVSILRNTSSNGTVSFATTVNFITGFNPYSVAIGDIDRDGKPDLAIVNAGENTVSVLRNVCTVGSVNFAAKVDYGVGSSPASVAIVDLNGDGKPELVVANSITGTVSILRNIGNIGTVNFAFLSDFTVGLNPRSIAIGDINGDGKFDLAIANRNGASVSLLRNISSGGTINFDTKVDFATGTNPNQVAIGDLDGDGKLDLAIANDGSSSLSIFRNTASSGGYFSFASKVDFTSGSNPRSVAIGDLNGDGKPDIALANYSSNSVSVLRNNPKFIPTITSFTPTNGAVGTLVTITGSLFDPIPANNIVYFGATRATVNSATTTSLVVTVPLGATFAPLTELNTSSSLAGYSSKFFNPIHSPSKASINSSDLSTKVDFITGLRPESVVVGDINGDGKPDLAIIHNSSNTVSVLRNTGNSGTVSFAIKLDFIAGNSPTSLAIGDIDGDGKLDLVVTSNSSNTISILRNTSSGGSISFATKVDFTSGSNPGSVVIGDINGDGKPDLAIANENSNNVSILRNTGSSGIISFAAKVDFTSGLVPKSLSIGDLDGDGRLDLAITNYNSNTVSVLRNTSNSGVISFATKIDFITGSGPQSIAVGDLDGDGKSELVITNYNNANVSIFRNTSSIDTISFITKVDFATGINPRSVAIGDIDGDGKPDLAVANNNNNSISVLRNIGLSGTINFGTKVDFGTGSGPFSVTIGDMDGDGKLDVVIANRNSNTVSILRNNPQPPPTISSIYPINGEIGDTVSITGTFFNNTPAYNIVFFGATRAIVMFSTDTSLTVTVPKSSTFAPVTVLNTGSGFAAYSKQFFNPTFSPNKGSINNTDMATKIDFTTGSNPNSVAIGDIDGDGKPDLTIANYGSNTVSVLRNTSISGIVSFATKIDFATGINPTSVAIDDINGDGKPDLVITNSSTNNVSILRNTSNIDTVNFATKVDFATGINPTSLAIGDLDADGKPDLTIANYNSNTVSVLRNTGSSGIISFATKVDFSTGLGPYMLVIGDLDGDSKPDLAITNSSVSSISVLRNTSNLGTINFATQLFFTTGSNPYSIAIGDIDGDGKLDIAAGTLASNSLSVLRNIGSSGTISFATKVDFTAGPSPQSIAIGDIDGDSKPDLAIAYGANYVSILRNTTGSGTINFALKVDFGTGSLPESLAVGDLDGDGKSDLAVANYSSNTISVIHNNPQFSPTIMTRGTLKQFNSCVGTASAQQTFTIEGVGLADNIVVTAPTGFEVSTNSNSAFGSSINLNQTSGIVNRTIIFTRLKNSATGSPSGSIICTSTGATTKNVAATSLLKATSTNITNISICPNLLPYNWNGRTYNSNRIDTIYLTNTFGCDSFNIINLTIKPTSTSTSNISICPSVLPYTWNGETYNNNSTDTVYLTNSVGCDSVTILKLTVKSNSTSKNNISICSSVLPFSWNGRTYITNKTDTVYLTNSVGCDSITILNLTIKSTTTSITNTSICPSALPYTWNGRTYNASSTDTVYLTNSVSCDSITILNLTIKPTTTSLTDTSICPSSLPYTWNSRTYNATKTDSIYLTNSAGCDSLAILKLTIKQVTTSTNNISICPSSLPYTWNGLVFNAAGTQTKTGLINSVGCDSSATLNLIVNPTPNTSNIVGLANATRLDTSSYSVSGTSGSVFNWLVSGATIQSGAGSNQIQVKWSTIGAQMVNVTETSNQGCVGVQKSLSVNVSPGIGINELKTSNQIIVYPNPFNETIHITLLNNVKLEKAIIYNLIGSEVISSNKNEIDASGLKSGAYLITIIDDLGNSYNKKLIKN